MKFTDHIKLIQEGGNFGSASEIMLPEIGSDREDGRKKLVSFIEKVIDDLNKLFKKKLIPKEAKPYSGSTRILMSGGNYNKDRVGDIDIMVPKDEVDNIKKILSSVNGKKLGGGKVIESRVTPKNSKKIISDDILVIKKDFGGKEANIQIDIEYAEYKDGKPTEWSQISRSSPQEDFDLGIKGAIHKEMLRALSNAVGKKMISNNIVLVGKNGQPLKRSEKDLSGISNYAFNVFSGLRTKRYKNVGEIDGKTALQEIPTGESKFTTNVNVIFRILFGKTPTQEDKELFKSFVGLTKLSNKYLSSQQKKRLAEYFSNILFGSKGLTYVSDDDGSKKESKQNIWDIFNKNIKGHGISKQEINKKIENYYGIKK